jgi:hypothetical protein
MNLHALLPPDRAAWEQEIPAPDLSSPPAPEGLEIRRVTRWSGGRESGTLIREINAALEQALADQADILLVGHGCVLTPGSLPALLRAAGSGARTPDRADPMILALAPRHNGGGVSAFPHVRRVMAPEDCAAAQTLLRAHFPPVSYAPVLAAPCLYLKTLFLNDIGLLDEGYGRWENALDDLLLRANRYGFRAALANHAYARISPASLAEAAPQAPGDRARLEERYPEIRPALADHLAGAEYGAESLFTALAEEKPLIAFDFSYFSPRRDGTTEAGTRLIRAAGRAWAGTRLAAIAVPEVWEAYRLREIPDLICLAPEDPTVTAAAVLRVGQPFRACELPRLFRRAPVVAVMMLDTIALDCHYIRYTDVNVPDLDLLWSFTCREADIIFTQSDFTLSRLRERFTFGPQCLVRVSRHSLDPAEYAEDIRAGGDTILIVGNAFRHKFVAETAAFLAPRFPDKRFVAVGCDGQSHPNVTALASGGFDEETFSRMYLEAECVIFPSTYEGFGFPLLHSLARGKVVYARDSALNRELAARARQGRNIRFFRTLAELALRLEADDKDFAFDPGEEREAAGWERSAGEILAALREKTAKADVRRVADRLRLCEAVFKHPGTGTKQDRS